MKYFSQFLSNAGGWSILAQLYKTSLEETRTSMEILSGKDIAPVWTACAQAGPEFSDLSMSSFDLVLNF